MTCSSVGNCLSFVLGNNIWERANSFVHLSFSWKILHKECKVSVRNKVKEMDVKQDNLKKRQSKNPKISLHQDSEIRQKGRNKKKKRKTQTKNRNKQQQSNRRYKEGEAANASQETVTKGKKQERTIRWEPQGATQAERVRLTLSLSWQAIWAYMEKIKTKRDKKKKDDF